MIIFATKNQIHWNIRVLNENELIGTVEDYGFTHEETRDDVCVFSFISGPFVNALMIPLSSKVTFDIIKREYEELEYTCQVVQHESIKAVDLYLFKESFDIRGSKQKIKERYDKFAKSKVNTFEDGKYSYINPQYSINTEKGSGSVVTAIIDKLSSDKPTLFLVEAAAGFGKTCTAFELLKILADEVEGNSLPLFSELSKNRQAKIFRYVLLDEIVHSFSSIKYDLVEKQIKAGRIPVILDGFDEMLHESKADEGYEEAESMLDTIGEFLTEKAKVVLTTRKSAIFDGDGFHQWVEDHKDKFDTIRINIDEPSVQDWLPRDRLQRLEESDFNIKNISNPVLLFYLRSMKDHTFDKALKDPTGIVEQYLESMLNREKTRQELKMDIAEQKVILKTIANDMMEQNYTSESRDYIIDLLENKELPLLTKAQKKYKNPKLSIDQISNKLASHALLDRNAAGDKSIGFINEFVLGHFCAEVVATDPEHSEYYFETRFIQPCVLAYENCSIEKKQALWRGLGLTLSDEKGHNKINYSQMLFNEIRTDLDSDNIENISLSNLTFGSNYKVLDSNFFGCNFESITFDKRKIKNVTFVNCKFYNCHVIAEEHDSGSINFINCTDDSQLEDTFKNEISTTICDMVSEENITEDPFMLIPSDLYILEKFWPRGGGFHKHRPIKGLITKTNSFEYNQLLNSIQKLKKINYLTIPTKRSFLELNQSFAAVIKEALDNAANQ